MPVQIIIIIITRNNIFKFTMVRSHLRRLWRWREDVNVSSCRLLPVQRGTPQQRSRVGRTPAVTIRLSTTDVFRGTFSRAAVEWENRTRSDQHGTATDRRGTRHERKRRDTSDCRLEKNTKVIRRPNRSPTTTTRSSAASERQVGRCAGRTTFEFRTRRLFRAYRARWWRAVPRQRWRLALSAAAATTRRASADQCDREPGLRPSPVGHSGRTQRSLIWIVYPSWPSGP